MLTKEKPAAAAAPAKVGKRKRLQASKRKRPQLGIIVTQEMKDQIEQLAKDSGRSMGQQAEYMLEQCLAYKAALTDMRGAVHTMQDVETHVIESVLFRRMWTAVPTDQGDRVWAAPGTKLPITITRKP